MSRGHSLTILCGLGLLASASGGCTEPISRSNAPPQGYAEHQSSMAAFYNQGVDNAAQSDIALADIHFIPHTPELNSLGTMHLGRLAALMDDRGGQVRYTTYDADEQMLASRLDSIRDFLESTGMDMNKVAVEAGPAGSSGAFAPEAIAAREKGMKSKFGDYKQSSGEMVTGE